MFAALATIACLSAILLLAKFAAAVVDDHGSRIWAALLGQSDRSVQRGLASPVQIRTRARPQRVLPARAQWRAAA